jgi:hypothetical protein
MDSVKQINPGVNLSIPTTSNHFDLRQQRMESVLAGYRLQGIPNKHTGSYIDGLMIRARRFIIRRPDDAICWFIIAAAAIWLCSDVFPQVVQNWYAITH